MPLISTRGGLSSRGFGQFGRTTTATLNTLTFPAGSTVFVAPATTNNLISAVGSGADGSPGGSAPSLKAANLLRLQQRSTSYAGGLALTYEQLAGSLTSVVNQFNTRGPTFYYNTNLIEVGPNNLCDFPSTVDRVANNIIAGSARELIFGNPPTSGPVTFASVQGKVFTWRILWDELEPFPPSTGADTTGFGLTFPGGAGGPSTTTTFNNVAVVPNQTYVITNNKSLTITYFS
jgi:hypothetical protein